jgi:SdrD B-like domain
VSFGVSVCTDPGPPSFGIEGFVYFDTNQNGARERGEAGLAGATLQLLTTCDNLIEATTDASGHYAYTPGVAGGCIVYGVLQRTPEFRVRTTPNPHPVRPNVTPGETLQIDFGVLPVRR